MDKASINQRFKEAVNFIISSKTTTTKTKIAENIGIKYGVLAEILAGRMNASAELISSLSSFYHISTDFLLLGKGEMLRQNDKNSQSIIGDNNQMAGNSICNRFETEIENLKKQLSEKDVIIKDLLDQNKMLIKKLTSC